MSSTDRSDLTDLDRYGRAAARLSGLTIEEEWWPAVQRHLGVLLEHAAGLDRFEPNQQDGQNEQDEQTLATPAPVFQP